MKVHGITKMASGSTRRLPEWIKTRLIPNFQRPRNDIYGWVAKKLMVRNNNHLELNAVQFCNIKPDYKVLEVGFGPGLGLQAAHNIVKKGKGKVYGIDTSFYMVDMARRKLRKGVGEKKVVLFHGSAANIPLNTDSIDRVYHCNCYYFWPSMRVIMREIYRVMKPGALMVTTLSLENLRKALDLGLLTDSQIDPVKYMTCLENYGFEGVQMEYKTDKATGRPFQVIYAAIGEKPAHHADFLSDDDYDSDDDVNANDTNVDRSKGKVLRDEGNKKLIYTK